MIGFHPCPRPPARRPSLYESGWSPKATPRAWDRTSMTLDSTRRLLRDSVVPGGIMTEAVGWFDDAGALRILVCDFDSGKRLTLRVTSRGTRRCIERRPASAPRVRRPSPAPSFASGAPA